MRNAISAACLCAIFFVPAFSAAAEVAPTTMPAPAEDTLTGSAERLQASRDQVARLMDEGDDKAALPLLDAIIRAAPDDGAAYNDRGLARWHSIDLHDRADEGFAALQNRLCLEVQSDCDQVRLALADFGRSIALETGARRTIPYANRAEVFFSRGDTRQALADEDEALRLRPVNAPFHRRRAEMRLALGDRAGALTDLDAALRLVDDAATLARRAELRKTVGDIDGARENVTRRCAGRLRRGRILASGLTRSTACAARWLVPASRAWKRRWI